MFDFIEKLRQKPESTKKKIAFVIALSLSGLIFVIWISVVYPDWRETQNLEARANSVKTSPTGALTDTLAEGFSAISNQFKEMKETISNFSTSADYYKATSSDQSTTTNISQ